MTIMNVRISSQRIGDCAAQILVMPIFVESNLERALADLDELSGNMFSTIAMGIESSTTANEMMVVPFGEKKVVLVGLGSKVLKERRDLRNCFGALGRKLRAMNAEAIAIDTAELNGEEIIAAIEGITLGNYEFDTFLSNKRKSLTSIEIIAANSIEIESAIQTAVVSAETVNLAREWTNLPAAVCTPSFLADEAKIISEQYKLECIILNRLQMQELGMGGLLGVSRGSSEAPKLVVLKYYGAPDSSELTAYVGKGVTFDSGGLSLKQPATMIAMKRDMAGAACVLAATKAIAQLGLRTNIMTIMPLCENMPSGNALQPGEIIRTLSGKTVEVHSTDAEGRIILADAVTYAVHLGATRLVDVATLTAITNTLGNVTAGIIDNNSEWCYKVVTAGAAADERLWRFPNYSEYKELLKTPFADLKNSSATSGTVAGGLFIGEFVDGRPWVHIDIAGTAWNDNPYGINPAGASGSMVKTLIELAKL
ncbi:MAG: leucyl aminopeptidase [Bacillota bacterium]